MIVVLIVEVKDGFGINLKVNPLAIAAVSADDQRSAQFLALLILARGNRMKKGGDEEDEKKEEPKREEFVEAKL